MDVFALTMRLKAEGGAAVDAALTSMRKSFNQTTTQANKLDAATSGLSASFRGLAASIAAGFGAREMGRIVDSWTSISARLAMVTKNSDELALVQGTLFDLAQSTRTAFEDVSALYLRTANAATALGITQEEVLKITRTVAQATALSGASAGEAASAIQQLGQAFGNGMVQAQEWTSIAEQTPRLARAIAESFDMTTAQFGKAVREQKVSSQDLARALLANTKVAAEAAKLPVTISGAFVQLRNEVGRFVNAINQSTGAAQIVVNVLQWIQTNLPTITALIVTATAAWVAYRTVLIGVTATQTAMAIATALAGKDLKQLLAISAGGAAAVMVFMEVASRLEKAVKNIGQASSSSAEGIKQETLALSGNAKAGATRLEMLQELANIAPITQSYANELRTEYERLTEVLKAGNLTLARRLELEKQRVAIAEAMAAAQVVLPAGDLAQLERRMTTGAAAPIRAVAGPALVTTVDPRLAESAKQAARNFSRVVDDSFAQEYLGLQASLADQFGNVLVNSIASAFENLTALDGSIKSAFKTLTAGLLAGLGSMLIEFGRYVILAGKLIGAVRAALQTMNPITSVAAGLAMIAIGGMLRGAASRTFGGGAGGYGGGGGYSMPSTGFNSMGGTSTLPTVSYGPTMAGRGNTIQQTTPMSITVIGPNDPSAQRQMQELMRNAQRRGEA